jgi:hypothetical protein
MYMAGGPLGARSMYLFLFLSVFSFFSVLLVFFRSWFLLVFHIFTGLDFLFEFKICSILKYFFIIFEFLFRFEKCSNSNFCSDSKICSNSKIVQILILLKLEFCSNSILLFKFGFLFEFNFCSNIKFVQV